MKLSLSALVAGITLATSSLNAQAVVALPLTSVFEFVGVCDDCVLNSTNGLIGKLTLSNYTEGSPIDFSNFVSFEYIGSNIVDPYTVVYDPDNPFYIYGLSGTIDTTADVGDFSIEFEDGLKFTSSGNSVTGLSDWYTCGRGVNGYYSGTCNVVVNQDFGTGEWIPSVPEPSGLLSMSAGVLGLLALCRRRRQA